jgi:acyl-CoA thioesterase YciA
LRAIAMPADTNAAGDIFGGWLLSQMDLAGGTQAHHRARGRVATVAIEAMVFHKPVRVGDEVSCYAAIKRIGRTSITMNVGDLDAPDRGRATDEGDRRRLHLCLAGARREAASGAGRHVKLSGRPASARLRA